MQSKTVKVQALNLPKFRPSLSLDEDDLPELKNLKVGDKCTIQIEAELTNQSKGEDYDDSQGRKVITGRFKLLSAKYVNNDNATKEDKLARIKAKANY